MKRKTFRYTYRSTYGIDIETVAELLKSETVDKAVEDVIKAHQYSTTPLVRVNGKKIDITAFLEKQKRGYEKESERCKLYAERLGREMKRRQKEK